MAPPVRGARLGTHEVVYEDLTTQVATNERSEASLLIWDSMVTGPIPPPRTRRESDELNEAWVAAYLTERTPRDPSRPNGSAPPSLAARGERMSRPTMSQRSPGPSRLATRSSDPVSPRLEPGCYDPPPSDALPVPTPTPDSSGEPSPPRSLGGHLRRRLVTTLRVPQVNAIVSTSALSWRSPAKRHCVGTLWRPRRVSAR